MTTHDRLSRAISYLLVGGMMACLAATIVQLGEQLARGWQGSYLVPLAFLVALEACTARWAVNRLRLLSRDWLIYRATEWVVLLVALKGLLYILRGVDQLWIDLPRWSESFFPSFFTGEYLAAVVVTVLVWNLADWFAADLIDLEADEARLKVERATAIPGDRPAARQSIAGRMFRVGAFMIVLAALARLDIQQLGIPYAGTASGATNIVVFFLLGLLLLSQGQLSILRATWSWQQIDVPPEIASNWLFVSLAFLAGVTLIAALLPTSYSLNLLETLGYVIQLLIALVVLVVLVIQALIFLPLVALLRLLGLVGPEQPGPPEPLLPPPPMLPAGGPDWLELLRSIIFWCLFVGVIGYSTYHYLKQRQGAAATLLRLPLIGWLAAFWQRLRSHLRVSLSLPFHMTSAARRGQELPAPGVRSRVWHLFRPGRLSPRELILYFYLTTVRRAAQSGLPRRPGQTPDEYSTSLTQALPEASPDIQPLTRAFVEARYSRHAVVRSQADSVRHHWERVKALLVRRRRLGKRD